jgi:hypothetical protein
MITRDDPKNPFVHYLEEEGITSREFAIIARVDNVSVYDARKAHCRALPKSFIPAIDERSHEGAGAAVAQAYLNYREELRKTLMMKK